MPKKLRLIPYWLRSSERLCSSCRHGYAYAVERRCVYCDSALCPTCAVIVDGESFCAACSDSLVRKRKK